MKIQVIEIPRELLSLHEEVDISLDTCCVNGQLFVTSISHEKCYRTSIPRNGADKKTLMKAVE